MRIVLLGPPGSGKGTQAKLIEQECNMPHISTGDMLREAVVNETDLGHEAKGYMEAGKLVPDDLMMSIVADRLQQADCQNGFILDGFPRTVGQARELDSYLKRNETSLDVVISIEVEAKRLIERLASRRLCRGCSRDYNLMTNPPQQPGQCDVCGGELYQREDDRAETVTSRLKVYEEQTAPLKSYYERAGLLENIDGSGGIQEVFKEIATHLNCAGR